MEEKNETLELQAEREKAGEIEVKPKKFEFSKLITLTALVLWVSVIIFGIVMVAITLDLTGLVVIVGSVDAVVAIVYPTYAKKATAENMIKLKKIYGYDAESVVHEMLRPQDYETD